MSGAKTCLIVIDAMRYDQTPWYALPQGLHGYRCHTLADTTEPSLTTILSGLPPWEHGIEITGQKGAERLLRRVKNRLLPAQYSTSFIASPAVLLHPHFTHSITLNRMEEIRKAAVKYEDKVEFMLLHCMDVHDLAVDMKEVLRYYKGFEPIPEWVKSWSTPAGLKRPYQETFDRGDAGLLKACYKAAVMRVFKEIVELVNYLKGWKIVITGDHGESFIYWHHDSVPDDVYQVPLITNVELEEREFTHLDVYELCRRW